MPTLYLIDGNSYIYRAFYAVRGLTASDGTPTNAIYGFINMVFKILRDKQPDYFSIVFDTPGPTHRHEAYEDYKSHRPGMPDELKAQIPLIKEIVDAFRIHTIELEGYEADDLLGTIAKMAETEGFDVLIVTGDKDMCQAVSPKVKLYDSMKEKITEEEDVIEKFGVPPAQFPEIIALMGDASDNIPGAPGIGEKTAVKLLKEFGNLEKLLENHSAIKNARARNSVAENMDNIRMSRELATIHSDLKLDLSLDDLKRNEPDWARLRDFFRALEFSSLARLIPDNKSGVDTGTEYITVTDQMVLKEMLKTVKKEIAIDTETTSVDPMKAELVGISLSAVPGKAYYIPLAHSYPDVPKQLDKKEVLDELKGIIEDHNIGKTGHNIKYDLIILKNEGLSNKTMGENIDEFEDVPAFVRKNIEIDKSSEKDKSEVSKFILTDDDDEPTLRDDNAYLNDNVD